MTVSRAQASGLSRRDVPLVNLVQSLSGEAGR